jgi:hypothetical protein
MRALLILGVVLGMAMPAGARKRPTLPCPDGSFVVSGPALMDPQAAPDVDVVLFRGTQIVVESGCGPAKVRVKKSRAGDELRIRWPRCDKVRGRVRIKARFDGACEVLNGELVAKKVNRRLQFVARRQRAAEEPGDEGTTSGGGSGSQLPDGTFRVIVERVFRARGCVSASCHGAAAAGGLHLHSAHAYATLVGVPATNAAARATGQLRVKPGRATESFLSRKLHGTLGATEGSRMPLVGDKVPVIERDLIDMWINAGAPAEGKVPGAPELSPVGYQPAPPLPPPPPPGVQVVLNGPMLAPGAETEGCMWIPSPNDQDLLVGGIEISANPGTHHIAVWRYGGAGTPAVNQWVPGDIACLSSGAGLGSPIGGTGVGLLSTTSWGREVATVLPGRSYFGLNAHYYNEFDVPIQVKFMVNYLAFEGTPLHTMQGITSLDTTFGINVPPSTQRVQRGRYQNVSGRTEHILHVGGHMHKRGLRFSAWFSDGAKVFDDYDWEHPVGRVFDPPYELPPGGWFDYECLHDNGVTRPVRRDGRGNPTTVLFGTSAEDEMCILVGSYYID